MDRAEDLEGDIRSGNLEVETVVQMTEHQEGSFPSYK